MTAGSKSLRENAHVSFSQQRKVVQLSVGKADVRMFLSSFAHFSSQRQLMQLRCCSSNLNPPPVSSAALWCYSQNFCGHCSSLWQLSTQRPKQLLSSTATRFWYLLFLSNTCALLHRLSSGGWKVALDFFRSFHSERNIECRVSSFCLIVHPYKASIHLNFCGQYHSAPTCLFSFSSLFHSISSLKAPPFISWAELFSYFFFYYLL